MGARQDDGYIKFHCEWQKGEIPADFDAGPIIECRSLLYEKGLVGVYPNGISFGNISQRHKDGMIITASGIGGLKEISRDELSYVCRVEIEENRVYCKGPLPASSESMTHWAVYAARADANFVIHCHNEGIWQRLMDGAVLKTTPEAEFGTVRLAEEVMILARGTSAPEGIIVFAGHRDGFIAYAKGMDRALSLVLSLITG